MFFYFPLPDFGCPMRNLDAFFSSLPPRKVVVNDVKEVDAIRQREMDITKERIEKILSAGATVVLTTKGIDDLCLKYFVEAGAMAVR